MEVPLSSFAHIFNPRILELINELFLDLKPQISNKILIEWINKLDLLWLHRFKPIRIVLVPL